MNDEQIEALLSKRIKAIRDADHMLAETILWSLALDGIIVEDHAHGSTWRRIGFKPDDEASSGASKLAR